MVMMNITIVTPNISAQEGNVTEKLVNFWPAVHEEEGGEHGDDSEKFSETDLDTEKYDGDDKEDHQQKQVEYQPVE